MDGMREETILVDGTQYFIYDYSGYNSCEYRSIPFQGSPVKSDQAAFNQFMSSARITLQWMFMELKSHWNMIDFPRKIHVLRLPAESFYMAAMVMSNFRNCMYRNQTSLYFNCKPLTIHQFSSWRN